MQASVRISLLMISLLCGGYVAVQGMSFSRAVEPELYGIGTTLFWLAIGAVATSPLWLPATVPAKFPRALIVARVAGAIGALVLAMFLGLSAVHNISRALSGLGANLGVLAQSLGLSSACLLGLVLLLRPVLVRRSG